jgi:hypothetical protein
LTTIAAQPVARSIGPYGHCLTTIQARYPKCIHGECKTHRLMYIGDNAYELLEEVGLMDEKSFSRNASSSRAIPVKRLIDDVMHDPYIPIHWGKNQRGMQAAEETSALIHIGRNWFDDTGERYLEDVTNERAWLLLRDHAVRMAEAFDNAGYHKQIVNRLIEPWAHINVVITSTNWSNFLALRDHGAAQPEMEQLAKAVREAVFGRAAIEMTRHLEGGEWHLPYVLDDERFRHSADCLRSASVARVARVSYLTHDGKPPNMADDMRLYNDLIGPPMHASPFEHQAVPDLYFGPYGQVWQHPELHGNLEGFIQYRKMLPGECA